MQKSIFYASLVVMSCMFYPLHLSADPGRKKKTTTTTTKADTKPQTNLVAQAISAEKQMKDDSVQIANLTAEVATLKQEKEVLNKNSKEKNGAYTTWLMNGASLLLGFILGLALFKIISTSMSKSKKKVPSDTPISEGEQNQTDSTNQQAINRIAVLEKLVTDKDAEIQRLQTQISQFTRQQPVILPAIPQQQAPQSVNQVNLRTEIAYTNALNNGRFNRLALRQQQDIFKITLQFNPQNEMVKGIFEINEAFPYYEQFPSYAFLTQGCDFIDGIIPTIKSRIKKQVAGTVTTTPDGFLQINQKIKINLL